MPCACGCGWAAPTGCTYVPGHVLGGLQDQSARRSRAAWLGPLGVVLALLLVAGVASSGDEETAERDTVAAAPKAVDPSPPTTAPAPATAAPVLPKAPPKPRPATTAPRRTVVPVLLQADGNGDGDSWRDTQGREYRLGLVNTPESSECFGAQATTERKARTARGFSARSYAEDRYGRAVSVVTTADGRNLNVHLARRGFADDRFLAQFRHENPPLAAELDRAFAAAKAEGAGLWSACRSAQVQGLAAPRKTAAPAGDCHPDYATCIPVKGDGSGRGAANDLDCGDITGSVRLRQSGVDPYRLDADGDGTGCD